MSGPLIVQSDRTLLLEVDHEQFDECRRAIAPFAELERAPEHVHTYRITSLALWNARAAGHDAADAAEVLTRFARYPVPPAILVDLRETMERYGRLAIESDGDGLVLHGFDLAVLEEVARSKKVAPLLRERLGRDLFRVPAAERGRLKQALLAVGWPAVDTAGYVDGVALDVDLVEAPGRGLRTYQREAAESFLAAGSGLVVLPCGSGKTMVGAAVVAGVRAQTLILVTSTVAIHQWRRELATWTTLNEEDIGEYSGATKDIRAVTIATYQILIARRGGVQAHLDLVAREEWGLIVYDEVHLLPAPVFRMTAEIQARRRLGLTATLVREDGAEGDVFTLIGPKRYDVPWREIERQGWIAPATCIEVRITLPDDERMAIALAEPADAFRLAATTPGKLDVVERILARHPGDPALVIGQYLDQLDDLAARLSAPLITGRTPNPEREALYAAFRAGELRVLVVSKVANFSIDLPEASLAIQVSGMFGSRQEEAQRLGRVLRPKADGRQARFYTVVARDTSDAEFASRRQRFLAEQGYGYVILDADDLG
jgi:DNA excision repair protein ERCC-3